MGKSKLSLAETHVCELDETERKQLALQPPPPGASIGERLLYWWRKQSLVSESNPQSKLAFRSFLGMQAEKTRQMSIASYIIHPYSRFRAAWVVLMIVVLLLSTFHHSFVVAFLPVDEVSVLYVSLGLSYDVVCAMDILVSFFTGYKEETTRRVVLDPKIIARSYLRGMFILDLLTTLPLMYVFWALASIAGYEQSDDVVIVLQALDFLKVLRVCKFFQYLSKGAEKIQLSYNGWKLARMILMLVFYIHQMTCLHNLIPKMVHGFNKDLPSNSWVNLSQVAHLPIYAKYLYCLRRTFSISLKMNFGQFKPERTEDITFLQFNGITGALLTAYYTVVMLSMITSRMASETKFFAIMNQTREYMRHKQLPLNMQKRLLSYYDYRFHQKYYREKAILATLPDHLAQEVLMFSCQRMIAKTSFFDGVPASIVSAIVSALKPEVFLPGDTVFRAGAKGDCMFFLSSGTIAVYTNCGQEIAHYTDGDIFGHIALVTNEERRYRTLQALEICEVFRLSRRDFRRLLVPYPDLYARVELAARNVIEESLEFDERVAMRESA